MLKPFLSVSVLTAKLLTLVCFSNMGLIVLTPKASAQKPCHEMLASDAAQIHDSFENCETCVLALEAWSEAFVTANLNHKNPLEVIITVSEPEAWQQILAVPLRRVLYRPPPSVVINSALPPSVTSTVLIV